MRVLISAAAAVSIVLGAVPVLAKEMHCNVNADMKDQINGMSFKKDGVTYKFKVKGTFKGVPESVSSGDYNNFINIKFGTEKTKSKDLNVRVRPRKSSECLNSIYNDNKKAIWSGAYCDTKNHKKAKSVTLRKTDDNDKMYYAAGAARTATKQSTFMAFYFKPQNEYILSGVCVENK